MKIRILFLSFFATLCTLPLAAQVSGTVTDRAGEPLPFASIYLKGTTTGTTSNVEGEYKLELAPGAYHLVFQYVGYRQKTVELQLGAEPYRLDITLEEEAIQLAAVEVLANAEDPAYAIIRKAIARREYFRDQVEAFSCDVYIKGAIKVLDAPEKVLGVEVGDMEGNLDSTRQGILYLSESESRLYFQQPDRIREVMVSSKVSGNDNGFSFNSAGDMNIDLYRNTSDFGRPVISPIAQNALNYYRYQLLGTTLDEDGRLLNKIKVMAKRPEEPVFEGIIYIVEDLWNIQGVDVFLTGSAINQPVIDTLYIKQVFVPVAEPDVWRMFSQSFKLKGGFFGFRFGGDFTAIYREYDLQPEFADGFFGNELFVVEEGANEKGLAYFDTIRPLPLTLEEKVDYVRKDSLQVIRRSKPYLDSLDAKNNKFTVGNLFFGYSYQRSYQRFSWQIGSPLTTLQYNTVQGWNGQIDLNLRKEFTEEGTRWLRLRTGLSYGFSDEKWRLALGGAFKFNSVNFARLEIDGGRKVAQFNPDNPISPTLNTLYSIDFRKNYLKLFDQTFLQLGYRQELVNGLYLRLSGGWAKREPLINRSDYSFFHKDRIYSSNDPQDPANFAPSFDPNQGLFLQASLRIRLGQKYLSYPDRKFILGSQWPNFWLHYRKGVPLGGGSAELADGPDYDYLSVQLEDEEVRLGLLGHLEFNVEAGMFLRKPQLYFMDFQHFNGNRTVLGNPFDYDRSFFLLPYYDYSTDRPNLQAHLQHHFDGFLLDRVPGIRRLGLTSVVGAKALVVEGMDPYWEVSFGIDRLGFGPLRFLRVDLAASFQGNTYDRLGVLIGLKLPTSEP